MLTVTLKRGESVILYDLEGREIGRVSVDRKTKVRLAFGPDIEIARDTLERSQPEGATGGTP